MNAIEISNLSKTFLGKKRVKVEALKHLSLDVEQGEVFGFLGPNGAGKSTTIKTLMGFVNPTSGSARIMGVDVASPLSRKQVGYLPENPAFYEYLNAVEFMSFVGAGFKMPEARITSESERILKLLELWDAGKRPIRSYSKGMVQRLGLAQTLLHDPEVYILDEPMSGLDPIGRALVKDIILDLKSRGKCVFFSTHITADVEMICDRVGIIVQGVLHSVEKVQTILAEGITGYRIRMAGKDAEGKNEVYIARENLAQYIENSRALGQDITLIEPTRKNLEDFFIDIVKGKAC